MLAALAKERLVQQRPGDKRYLPGPLLYELGLSLPGHHAFHAAAQAQRSSACGRIGGDSGAAGAGLQHHQPAVMRATIAVCFLIDRGMSQNQSTQ